MPTTPPIPMPDMLVTYLIVANAFALVLGLVDARSVARQGQGSVSQVAMGCFCLLGGCVGILGAAAVADRAMRKDNVAVRFLAIGCLVAWALVLANVYGWQRFDLDALMRALDRDHTPLLAYGAVANLVTFVTFCIDKVKAIRQTWRIPEATLLGLAMVGGSVGGMAAMLVARHKINTPYFKVGLPLMLALQLAVVAFLLQARVV